jgi:hypothetical protein
MILRRPARDSTFRPLEVVINGAGIECHDENERREIERIVDEALIEKTDRINENADRRYDKPQQQITVPYASDHSLTFRPTRRIRTAS